MTKSEVVEIKCDACNGTGSLPASQPELGRRIYPGRCTKCRGKGRVPRPEYSEGASPRLAPAQSCFQLLFLLLPTSLFGLRPFFDCGALSFDGGRPSVVLPFVFVECCQRLGGCLPAPLALLPPGGSLHSGAGSHSKASAALRATLSSVARGSCYLGFARAFSGLWLGSSPDRWVRRSASSPKGPSDPTGRLRMTPGFLATKPALDQLAVLVRMLAAGHRVAPLSSRLRQLPLEPPQGSAVRDSDQI